MQKIMQILVVIFLIIGLFRNLYVDINGRKAKEPEGFSAVVGTIIALVISILIYYYAGAFSTLF